MALPACQDATCKPAPGSALSSRATDDRGGRMRAAELRAAGTPRGGIARPGAAALTIAPAALWPLRRWLLPRPTPWARRSSDSSRFISARRPPTATGSSCRRLALSPAERRRVGATASAVPSASATSPEESDSMASPTSPARAAGARAAVRPLTPQPAQSPALIGAGRARQQEPGIGGDRLLPCPAHERPAARESCGGGLPRTYRTNGSEDA